jgi:pantoate--beta-alanine ligase
MSSRNAYLDPQQRRQALALSKALREVEKLFHGGERDATRLAAAGKRVFAEEPSVRLDYLEIVNATTLDPLTQVTKPALAAVAAYVGSARLIDNLVLHELS